jgi:hypothetical protein
MELLNQVIIVRIKLKILTNCVIYTYLKMINMKEKVTKKLETNVAELIMVAIFLAVMLSSCATTSCNQRNAWSASTNCPAYR